MSERLEFVRLAEAAGASMAVLCRQFRIARRTGYKWRDRYRQGGMEALEDRSRRPHQSPARTSAAAEQLVIELRQQHPTWGGRKLHRRLRVLGHDSVPPPSTITKILHRHGLIDAEESAARVATKRFEYPHPNDLWQMDFKGDFSVTAGGRCYPLTVLDDHSRYNIVLKACRDQRGETVRDHLTDAFQRYGMPRRMLMDNGSPWGPSSRQERFTWLTVWLLRLSIGVTHGRPYHPQTQGKEERFHRTLKNDVLRWYRFDTVPEVQHALNDWRPVYNHERPHEALDMATPAQRYRSSRREFPDPLPAIEYDSSDQVRKVSANAGIQFRGQWHYLGKAFRGHPVALRPTTQDGRWEVYFCGQKIKEIDERTGERNGRGGRSARSARPTTPASVP